MAIFGGRTVSWSSPGKYYQGPGLINHLAELTGQFGKSAYVIIDTFFYESFKKKLTEQFKEAGNSLFADLFGGQCSENEIVRGLANATQAGADIIVGIGGGKTLDTAKDIANRMRLPVIIIPTTASTDAPTSGLSVVYKENGEHDHVDWYKKNPDVILVDSEIIAAAPPRFLIAGMGDALATYFEARAHKQSNTGNPDTMNGGDLLPTRAGMAIAKECYDTLLSKGEAALKAVCAGALTPAVEDIIETNTLLSGLGFENTGCSGAHSIANGLTVLPEAKKLLHGECVAFGTLVELIAEGADTEEIKTVFRFCKAVGLPTSFEDMHIPETEENITAVAEASMHSFWDCEPVTITAEDVVAAIKTANAL